MALMKKELFICDRCGQRKRLPSAVRHWCDNCDYGGQFEMRPARDKRLVISTRPLPEEKRAEPEKRRMIY